METTCSPLLGVAMGVEKLLGFHVAALLMCARSLRVLQGLWLGNEPPQDLCYTTLFAGSNLKDFMPLVLTSAFKLFTVANLRYQLS